MRFTQFSTVFKIAVAVSFSVLLAGCGASSGTASNAGTVVLTSEADWVAFQDGPSGSWTVVTPDGGTGTTYTLSVSDTDGRYGIATHRFSTLENAESVRIVQGTRDDSTNVVLNDDVLGTIDATISNYTGSSGEVSTKVSSMLISVNGLYNLEANEGIQDVIAVERDASSVFLGGVSARGLSVSAGGTIAAPLDFSSIELTKNTTQTFTVTGTGAVGAVSLHTANGTSALVSESGSNYAYLNGTISSDMYLFQAASASTGKTMSEYYAASSNPGNRTADLTTMNGLTGASMNFSGLSGLGYTVSSSSPPLWGYIVLASQTRTPNNVRHRIYITSNWLGTNTTYSRPSFSGLPGYNTDWDFVVGTAVTAQANAIMVSGSVIVDFERSTQASAGTVGHFAKADVNFTP